MSSTLRFRALSVAMAVVGLPWLSSMAAAEADPAGQEETDPRVRLGASLRYRYEDAYYGYMDLFSWQNMHNAELSWKIALRNDVSFRVAYQDFWLAEPNTDAWYNAGTAKIRQTGQGQRADSHVGREVDLTVYQRLSLGRVSGSLEAGYSYFQAGAYVRDTGPGRNANFAYLQTRFEY